MSVAVLVDFGSTYTKMACADLQARRLVARASHPSTVHSDAALALNRCLDDARSALGPAGLNGALMLASSSAAGGLRMAVVGLTKSLSIKAGRSASFSAGAKIVYSMAGRLGPQSLTQLEASGAEILLLCGGYEGGNTEGVLHNAEMLGGSRLSIPVVYAGNSAPARQVRHILRGGHKECFLSENIIPAVGTLNTEPTSRIIRELFMSRITNMKGVGRVQGLMAGPIVPTPAAVLAAGELLSRGTAGEAGMGPLLVADVGGATTDIYSYSENRGCAGARLVGAPDPYAKRTVEGDMGMRESARSLVQEVGAEPFARRCGLTPAALEEAIQTRTAHTEYLGGTPADSALDDALAAAAIHVSARRHAGRLSREYNKGGHLIQQGKNLTEIKAIVGTGGVLVNAASPAGILKNAQAEAAEEGRVLLPQSLNAFVDRDYALFAAGLLRRHDEAAALAILKASLSEC